MPGQQIGGGKCERLQLLLSASVNGGGMDKREKGEKRQKKRERERYGQCQKKRQKLNFCRLKLQQSINSYIRSAH